MERLDDDAETLRARVLAMRAVELSSPAGLTEEADELSRESIRLAEHAGDNGVLAVALGSRHWVIGGPQWLDERCLLARRGLDLALAAEDEERILQARQWWIFDLLELGDIPDLLLQLDEYEALAARLRHPSECAYARVMRAMVALATRAADAAAVVDEAHELLQRAHDPDADRVFALQSFALHHQAGHFEEALQAVAGYADDAPVGAALRAWALASAGRLGQALEAAPPLAAVPADREWLITATALAQVAALSRDAGAAAQLHAALSPFEERFASLEGILTAGCVAASLASLAATLGDQQDARRLGEIAAARNETVRAALRKEPQPDREETVVPAVAGADARS